MFIDVFGSNLSGILPLQHHRYNRPSGGQMGWDLDLRAHKRCVRITGRWDTGGGLGQWEIDRDSVGDLCGGFCWLSAGKDKREVAYWSFAIPTGIVRGGGGTATRGAVIPAAAVGSGQMCMLPQGDKEGTPDDRLVPIPVKFQVMRAEGPQNAPPPPAPVGAGGRDILRVGLGTQRLGFQERPIIPGEPVVRVGVGAPRIGWNPPRVDPPANPNPRTANPAIGALSPRRR